MKRFQAWIQLKEKLHALSARPPHVSQGDIWWASIGENVGSEVNGKSDLFSRPVIIFRKLAHGFYFVIPTSTRDRSGSWFVSFRQQGRRIVACLHQSRAIDYRRLSSKLGTLDDEDYGRIRDAFASLYVQK
jgi:mRNA interferase MazF